MPKIPKFAKKGQVYRLTVPENAATDVQNFKKLGYDGATTMDAKKTAAFRIQVPNVAAFPPAMCSLEAGLATLDGFGRFQIKFEESFTSTPHVLTTPFGYWTFSIPWGIEWTKVQIATWSITIPKGLQWKEITLPSLAFQMNVDPEYFEIFNVAGTTYVSYLAIGE